MTTNNSLNVPLSGSTGTGNFVGATSPTLTTPNIVGTATNNNASAGSVGEVITSAIPYASRISIITATATDLTSISLTAGDWDVWGNLGYAVDTTTSYTNIFAWINTTSATLPDQSLYYRLCVPATVPGATAVIGALAPPIRLSLSGTTTVYISGYTTFTVSTMQFCGNIIARRVR